MSLTYSQITCFSCKIPMATQVSTASKGYKRIQVKVNIYIARMSLTYSQITCFSCKIPMATQVSTASKGYKRIQVNVGIYIARVSLTYSQITCFSCRIPMATQVSTASKGYKQIHVDVGIYIADIAGMSFACSQTTCCSSIQLSRRLREAFASLREAFARLTGGQGTPKTNSMETRSPHENYKPIRNHESSFIVEHRRLSPNNSSQNYILYVKYVCVKHKKKVHKEQWKPHGISTYKLQTLITANSKTARPRLNLL